MKFIKNLFTEDNNKKFQLKRDNLFLKNHDIKTYWLKWFGTLVPIFVYISCVLNLSLWDGNSNKRILLIFSWFNLLIIPLFCVNIIYNGMLSIEIKYSMIFILIMNIISSILNISLLSEKLEDDEDQIMEDIPPIYTKIIIIISWLTFIAYPLIIWVSIYFYDPSCHEHNIRLHKNLTNIPDSDL